MKSLLTKFVLLLGITLSSFGAVRGEARQENVDRLPVVSVSQTQAHEEADKLHIILTGFTTDNPGDIGPACAQDVVAMRQAFERSFASAGQSHRLVIHDLSKETSVPKVYEYLRKMNIGSRDMVVFYHSGHGGHMIHGREESSHELQINDPTMDLNRGQVRQILQGRNPFGLIILTDCCSAYSHNQPLPEMASRGATLGTLNWESVRNLFLVKARLVNITAAQNGKLASAGHVEFMDTGAQSAFTVAFLKVLQGSRVYGSWKEVYFDLSEATLRASGQRHKPCLFNMAEEGSTVLPVMNQERPQSR